MNSSNKVLVAYASKYGSTTEIAERIGQVLAHAGRDVDVLPDEHTGEIERYQASHAGQRGEMDLSALHFGRQVHHQGAQGPSGRLP
ncbi:MAG: hypothetical protein KatS3mg052_2465 [Candidatus Roseilinea sp.]|nr:MAG: hypothetical protein KatS3mg052_2465 [Candidatus Roseilinea sp.]